MESAEKKVQLTLTEGQAQAVVKALDFYMRVGIGQIEEVAELLRDGVVPMFRPNQGRGERQPVELDVLGETEDLLNAIKERLGYPKTGSHGIGHNDNHITVTRSYEVEKVLRKALIEERTPGGGTVDHDGLLVRYTTDPAPVAVIEDCDTMKTERQA